MQTAVGVFTRREDAERALQDLRAIGFDNERIVLLSPGDPERQAEAIPTTEGEQPGVGPAVGSAVGAAVGAATGLPLGAAVAASIVLPGVGPIVAIGVAAAAVLGAVGAAIGGALEHSLTEGLPKDEVFVYKDALRNGRSVLVALAEDATQIDSARAVLLAAGAESLDAARQRWWLGLRDAERERYVAVGRDFETDEPDYRRGFEAALLIGERGGGNRGLSYGEAQSELRARYPDAYDTEPFRRGYERGLAYQQGMRELRDRDAA